MIKINLLKNRGEQTQATSAGEINYETSFDIRTTSGKTSAAKDVFIKIIVMLMGMAGLFTYESFHISDLRLQLQTITRKKNEAAKEIEQKKPIAAQATVLQKQIQELEGRIKAIRELSTIRLREIKAVDYIQNVIPEKVWLKSLSFDEGDIVIDGFSGSDDQLAQFFTSLESKKSFANVLLTKSVEQKSKDGTVKVFMITAHISSGD